MTWSEPDKAVIKEMWEASKSASTIAVYFKTTRGAISGLCDRNGWKSPHAQGERKPSPSRQDPSGRSRIEMRRGGKNYMHEITVADDDIIFSTAEFDAAIPVEQRKTLKQLTDKTCKWPVGDPRDPGFFFCGAVQDGGYYPYCEFHHRAAGQPNISRGAFALPKWKTTAKSGW